MGLVLGIDVGGSTTKIVGMDGEEIHSPVMVKSHDPISSLFGAFGRYTFENHINFNDIEQIVLTGVGSSYIDQSLYGVPTSKCSEFLANGLGANYMLDFDKLIVISMGTGTSFVKVVGNEITHIGGMGIGGGTLQGFAHLLLKRDNIPAVAQLGMDGKLENIDLLIGDISKSDLPGLPLDVTASNFAKATGSSTDADIAAGLINMVMQTIGQAAYFASLGSNIKDLVVIGNLAGLPQCRTIFSILEKVYPVTYHIPSHVEFRTAIGAALSYLHHKQHG